MAPPATLPVLPAELGRGVRAGFTTRRGGVSDGPWRGLNLAEHTGDAAVHVAANRAILHAWVGASVWFSAQTHSRDVAVVGERPAPGDRAPAADAMVATAAGVAVGVLVADCVPILLADPSAGVVAAAHAGRRGLRAGVVEAVVEVMVAHGALAERVRAVIGPAAGACCYEVPEAMQAEVSAVYPAARSRTRAGTPSLDLRAGCRQALAACGVTGVTVVGGCTIEDLDLYSYRREPVTGRFAGFVVMAD